MDKRKEFIRSDTVRDNALELARRIHLDGFVPDIIYVLLRGGAYLGNVLSEYFKIVRPDEHPVFYAAVVARSYTDIRRQERVMVDGWTYDPKYLRHGDKVLLVDDIFDSGRTINHLTEIILENGIPRESVRVAVHDYKVPSVLNESLPVRPDYYCRMHRRDTDDVWIHYLAHELVGLTKDEIETYYPALSVDLKRELVASELP